MKKYFYNLLLRRLHSAFRSDDDGAGIPEESIIVSQADICTQESVSLTSQLINFVKEDKELYCQVLKYQVCSFPHNFVTFTE